MRICVYLKQQDHLQDLAPHETSRRFAAILVGSSIARPVGQNAVQLTTDQTWQEVKNLFRGAPMKEEWLGLLPPLDWYYPWTDLPQWLIAIYHSHGLLPREAA